MGGGVSRWQWRSLAAALDNNEVAATRWGQREDECNNQINYAGAEQALDKTTRGGGEQREMSGWRMMWGDLVASEARQSGGGRHDNHWAVDDTMRDGSGQSKRIERRMTQSKEGVDDPTRQPTTQREREVGQRQVQWFPVHVRLIQDNLTPSLFCANIIITVSTMSR